MTSSTHLSTPGQWKEESIGGGESIYSCLSRGSASVLYTTICTSFLISYPHACKVLYPKEEG